MNGSIVLKSGKIAGTHYTFQIPFYEDQDCISNKKKLKTFLEGKKALFIGRHLPFTANMKQLLALIWTIIAIVISLIVVLTPEHYPHFSPQWQTKTILFSPPF